MPPADRSSRSARRARRFAVGALFAAYTLAAPAAGAQVRAERPRLFMTPTTLVTLRARLPTDARYTSMVNTLVRLRTNTAAADALLNGNYPATLVHAAAFVAAVGRDATAISTAKSYLQRVVTLGPSADLTQTRNRLYAMAIAYDWLWDQLSASERAQTRDAIVAIVSSLSTYLDPSTTNFVESPSRWANVTAFAGALAITNEDARLDATLAQLLSSWRTGFNPVLDFVGAGGGHPMGWMYGPAYSSVEPAALWRSASTIDEPWNAVFLRDAGMFQLYAANGALEVPVSGDAWASRVEPVAFDQMNIASSWFGNGYVEHLYRQYESMPGRIDPLANFLRLITAPSAASPRPPDDLPLSRFFSGSGFLVARDQWSRAEATTMIFKASPFYSLGHHHRDEGSIVVDYRGPLLLDGGYYDDYGTAHHSNFYTRSVAHNTLLVPIPGEVGRPPFVPDGGQEVLTNIPRNLGDLRGAFARRGITARSDAGACVWARADVGDQYLATRVSAYTRDVLMVRAPAPGARPATFVLDRATLPAARRASILWHFARNTVVNGSQITADNAGGGRLRVHVLQPAAPRLTSYSGARRWTVNGADFPPASMRGGNADYWGRVEVSPPTDALSNTWATLLRVGDAALPADSTPVSSVSGSDWNGALLGSTLFAIASSSSSRISLTGALPTHGCVAGLAPNAALTVESPGGSLTVRADRDGLAVLAASSPSDAGAIDATVSDAGASDATVSDSAVSDGPDASSADSAVGPVNDASTAVPDALGAADGPIDPGTGVPGRAAGCACRAAPRPHRAPFAFALALAMLAATLLPRRPRERALRSSPP